MDDRFRVFPTSSHRLPCKLQRVQFNPTVLSLSHALTHLASPPQDAVRFQPKACEGTLKTFRYPYPGSVSFVPFLPLPSAIIFFLFVARVTQAHILTNGCCGLLFGLRSTLLLGRNYRVFLFSVHSVCNTCLPFFFFRPPTTTITTDDKLQYMAPSPLP